MAGKEGYTHARPGRAMGPGMREKDRPRDGTRLGKRRPGVRTLKIVPPTGRPSWIGAEAENLMDPYGEMGDETMAYPSFSGGPTLFRRQSLENFGGRGVLDHARFLPRSILRWFRCLQSR